MIQEMFANCEIYQGDDLIFVLDWYFDRDCSQMTKDDIAKCRELYKRGSNNHSR